LAAKKTESIISSVVTYIEVPKGKPAIDLVTESELKKQLKEDLLIFRGRKIYNIGTDSSFAMHLLEGKVYTDIGGKDYVVRVKTMLVADGVLHLRQ
jgi:hypothetical protein